jgi:hypothetical protein
MALGSIVNLALMLMLPRLGVWSNDQREFRLALVVSALAVSGLVTVIPVVQHGKPWQRVVGLGLLILPSLSLWFPLEFILKNK